MQSKYFLLGIVVLALALGGWWYWRTQIPARVVVTNFEDCVAAGYPIQESYPARCVAPDGQSFTQDIGNELELKDVIVVEFPRPNQTVSSPLAVTGQARGTWYFEAQFGGQLVDDSGNVLGTGIFTAQGEWMTTEFVPFSGTIEFAKPALSRGKLILEKSNPSDLPENDAQLIIPVTFAN